MAHGQAVAFGMRKRRRVAGRSHTHALVRSSLVLSVAPFAVPARASAAESIHDVLTSLPWSTKAVRLPDSGASYAPPPGTRIVVGGSAQRADQAINGDATSNTEGYLDYRNGDTLYLSYDKSGYVTADDFSKIDPDAMIADIKKSTEDANAERVQHGISPLHVDGWIAKPSFDAATETARFSTAAHDDRGIKNINAVALRLGRNGYERFTLVTDPSEAARNDAQLATLTGAYAYPKGARFADHTSGDKLAGFGIAALVGTAAGVTIAKTVGFGAILLLIKKFAIVLIVLVAGFFKRAKSFFVRRREPVPSMPQSSPFTTAAEPPQPLPPANAP